MSRTNHNILYFVRVSRTSPLNPANCLWKPRISPFRRGFERSDLHQIWGVARAGSGPQSNRSTRSSTVAPARLRHKVQNRCNLPALLFKLWRFGSNSKSYCCSECRVPSRDRRRRRDREFSRDHRPAPRQKQIGPACRSARGRFRERAASSESKLSCPCRSSFHRTISIQRTPRPGRIRRPAHAPASDCSR